MFFGVLIARIMFVAPFHLGSAIKKRSNSYTRAFSQACVSQREQVNLGFRFNVVSNLVRSLFPPGISIHIGLEYQTAVLSL
jgi:hypothetical protein